MVNERLIELAKNTQIEEISSSEDPEDQELYLRIAAKLKNDSQIDLAQAIESEFVDWNTEDFFNFTLACLLSLEQAHRETHQNSLFEEKFGMLFDAMQVGLYGHLKPRDLLLMRCWDLVQAIHQQGKDKGTEETE